MPTIEGNVFSAMTFMAKDSELTGKKRSIFDKFRSEKLRPWTRLALSHPADPGDVFSVYMPRDEAEQLGLHHRGEVAPFVRLDCETLVVKGATDYVTTGVSFAQ